MLRSLFSGVTGMRAHQTMMDVVGNNIANVNTAGYKSSQVVFEDTLSQMLKAAGAPQGNNGGTNPAQVGLGVNIGAIVTNYAQGATQLTGRSTDMAIQGDGFFAVRKGGEDLYTRAGAFSFDSNGTLVTPEGAAVQGWMGVKGAIDTNGPVSDIKLPLGTLLPPVGTTKVDLNGNLPNDATTGTAITRAITIYDTQGAAYSLSMTFTKNATANQWDVTTKLTGPNGQALSGQTLAPGSTTFSATDGTLATPAPVAPATNSVLKLDLSALTDGSGGSFPGLTSIDVDVTGLSQMGSDNTLEATKQDGSTMGGLQSFTISPDGTLVGVFSNGLKQPLGQIALASFNNPPGLEKVGNSLLRSSVNSGNPSLGVAGTAGRGTLASGTLEMSNVDLAQEFTNLIVAERGFQANSKVITSSDEILQDLVNLKR